MAALLGHSSPVISLSIYTHIQASQTVDAIALLDSRKALPVSSDVAKEQSSEDAAPASTEIEQLKKATA